jgi:hypothetical protein
VEEELMGKPLLFAGSVGLALLGVAAIALGATKTVNDPTGDLLAAPPAGVGSGDVDITQATAGKAGKKIELTVRVKGSIGKALGKAKTSPVFSLNAKSSFYLLKPAGGTYKVFNQTDQTQSPRKAASSKPDSHTASFTFSKSALGSPSGYKWRVTMGGCTVYDAAPDAGFANAQARRC